MDDLFFTKEEKDFFELVLKEGLGLEKSGFNWYVMRFALAKSLGMDGEPGSEFAAPRGHASELHLQQITGRGGKENLDFDAAFRMLLSVKHNADYFADQRVYVDMLQRHLRRGLAEMRSSWHRGTSFHDYLLDELYLDTAAIEDTSSPVATRLSNDRLRAALAELGIGATPVDEPEEGPRLSRFTFTLGSVDDYERLRRGLDDLAFALGLGSTNIAMGRAVGERRIQLDVPRPISTWHEVPWRRLEPALAGRREALPVCPGVDVMDRPFIFDMVEAPHLFVAGSTGSGKSVCLNAIILSLLAAERVPELVLIDPKGVDFEDYQGCPRLRGGRVIQDMGQAVTVLRDLVDEMDRRQAILREHGARTIGEAQAAGVPIDRIIVIIDELADFMMSKGGASEPLIRLAQKARSVGIHLILASQRPEAATFPGLLRSNVPSRIGLTVQKASESRIILDESGAERLLMRGDMLIKMAGRDTVRVHGARVDRADVQEAVRGTYLL
jgi:S-DNA-T family DNA segregation ATPase FtsK/SpoIIIE